MRLAGILMTACIVLAAAKAAALVIAIVVGVFFHPRETFCLLAGLIEYRPLACLGLGALVVVAGWVQRRSNKVDESV